VSDVSDTLRWRLILGCLVLAAILLPESALVLVQDLQGPWRGDAPARAVADATPVRASTSPLKQERAEASVALEDSLVRARRDPFRTDPRPVAVLLAR
jgi:hypothetical protein